MASCTASNRHARGDVGIDLRVLEVDVQSESDMRGLVGIPDVRTALGNMRMSVRIGAEGVNASMLRELAEWCDAHSAVSCTLRDRAPVAIEIAWFEEIVRRAWE